MRLDAVHTGLQEQLPWAARIGIIHAAAACSAAYLHCVLRRTGAPSLRLALGAPLIILNLWLPLLFDVRTEILSRTSVVFVLGWLGSFKVCEARPRALPAHMHACSRARSELTRRRPATRRSWRSA